MQGYLTSQQAESLLQSDLSLSASVVYGVWSGISGLVLTANQFNALVDIAFLYSAKAFSALTSPFLSQQAAAHPRQMIPLQAFSDWLANLDSNTQRDQAAAQLAAQCVASPGQYRAVQYDGQACVTAGDAGVCLDPHFYSYSGPAAVRGSCKQGYRCFLFPTGSQVALVNVSLSVTLSKAPHSIAVDFSAGPELVD